MSQVVIGDVLPYTQAIAIASQTVFSTNWTANTESDVVVYKTPVGDAPDDFTQQLQYPADYSVAFIGDEQQAQVTLTTGAAAGDIITIVRDTPADRMNLYSNTNFTPSMLNNDFGILTLVDQQAQLVDQKIAPRYNYSAVIEDVVDTILPVLEANETWVKNPNNTGIIPYELPAGGIAPSDATYITATNESASLPNSYVMRGTQNQIDVANGVISIASNPIIPGTAGISIPQGTTAQRVVPSFGVGLRYNTTTGQFEFWNGAAWAALDDSGLQQNYIYVGDASNYAAAVPMSGDASIVSSGAITVSKINTVPISLAGNFKTEGAYAATLNFTDVTNVFFPTSGTLATTSQIPTGAALTKSDDINVTLTLGGNPSTALVNAASITVGWSGLLGGTRGGSGVNNGSNTATYAGNLNFAGAFTTVGAFAVTQTYTDITNVTFPTSGTLATTSQIPTGEALTRVDDTNITLTLGGSPTTALINAASITAGWNGQLSVPRGGTGLAGIAINQMLYASSANTLSAMSTVNNSVLGANSSGVPGFTTSPRITAIGFGTAAGANGQIMALGNQVRWGGTSFASSDTDYNFTANSTASTVLLLDGTHSTVSVGEAFGILHNIGFTTPSAITAYTSLKFKGSYTINHATTALTTIDLTPNLSSGTGDITTFTTIKANVQVGTYSGTATNVYNGRFYTPSFGTNRIALQAGNFLVGFSDITPPSSGMAISGISVFGSSTFVNDTTLPSQLNATAATERYFAANKAGSSAGIFGFSNAGTRGTGVVVGSVTTDPILFYVNSTTEAARINSSGQLLIATTSSTFGARVEIGGSSRISLALVGTKTATDGSAQYGFFSFPTFAPVSNTSVVTPYTVYGQYNPPTGVTITTAINHHIQSGGQDGLGTVTLGIGLKVENPGMGSSKICAWFDGATTINTSTIDGSNKLTINGGLSVTNLKMSSGASSAYLLSSDSSGNGSWIAASSITDQSLNLKSRQVSSNTTMLSTDAQIGVDPTSSHVDIQLIASSAGKTLVIYDSAGTCSGTNYIKVLAPFPGFINGSAFYSITTAYGGLVVTCSGGATNLWTAF